MKETFDICKKDTTSPQVIKKLYMIANEVKPDYYFAETGPETGFFLTAKIQPFFVLAGEARKQIENEEIYSSFLKDRPLYKIKVKLYREESYELFWEFEHTTKNKKEIYKTIIDLKSNIENIIKENGTKKRKFRRIS